ncbi:MAG: metal ABC transporter solute-binding protein, Zn/Mn family, partial [Campylobacteraceae bacterium]
MIRTLGLLLLLSISVFAKPTVTVSIPPQKYIVEQISGDTLNVLYMVEPTANHETYEPKPAQMVALAKSDIYFTIGLPFEESWLTRFKNAAPNIKFVDTGVGINKLEMGEHHHGEEDTHEAEHDHDKNHNHQATHDNHDHNHSDHDHHDHDHKGDDPHIWLDPILLKTQAKNIADALSDTYPQNRDLYAKNLEVFNKKMDELNKNIEMKLKNLTSRSF